MCSRHHKAVAMTTNQWIKLARPRSRPYFVRMSKNPTALSYAFPFMMGRLAMASWETIFHRTRMMVDGSCSAAEYQKMVAEKVAAAQMSTFAMMTGRGQEAALAPYLRTARANARRLRSK